MAELANLEQTLREGGASPDVIKETLAEKRGQPVTILPVNATAARAFLIAASQWRFAPSGQVYGLDYSAAKVAWRYAGLRITSGDFARIQMLEGYATAALKKD